MGSEEIERRIIALEEEIDNVLEKIKNMNKLKDKYYELMEEKLGLQIELKRYLKENKYEN